LKKEETPGERRRAPFLSGEELVLRVVRLSITGKKRGGGGNLRGFVNEN
jgi:hypothetical protein